MKRFTLVFLSLFLFGIEGFSDYDTNRSCKEINKIIVTDNQGVFFLVEDSWLRADEMVISPDSIRVLVNNEWISLEDYQCDTYKTWRCRNCQTINPEGAKTCYNCKRSR